jgi:hypothetical protein
MLVQPRSAAPVLESTASVQVESTASLLVESTASLLEWKPVRHSKKTNRTVTPLEARSHEAAV